MDGFNFGQPGRRTPHVSLNPKVLMAVGALLAAGLAVFAFLSFVSQGGHEVADSQVTAVQQVDQGQDLAAQSNLRNALAAAKVLFAEANGYDGVTIADLAVVEASLTFTDGTSPDPATISVAVEGGQVGLAAFSRSGTCFYVRDDPATGSAFGSGSTFTGGTCVGAAALSSAVAPSW